MRVGTLMVVITAVATSLVGVPALAAGASLAVTATGRSGDALEPIAQALNLATGKAYSIDAGARKALPAGRYAVGAYIQEDAGKGGLLNLTVAARVVKLAGAAKVSFDTGRASKVSLKVDDPGARARELAVVPFATVNAKPRKFLNEAGIVWPAEGTYVLPSKDPVLSLGVHGVLGTEGTLPVRYDLAKAFTGGLPGKPAIAAKKAALAKVNLDVSVIDAGQGGFLALVPARPNLRPITGVEIGARVLGKQINYRSPNLQWASTLTLSGDANSTGFAQLTEKFKRKGTKRFTYAAGKTYPEQWGQGVWAPRANSPAIFSQGGRLNVRGGQPICPFAGRGVTLDDCQLQPTKFSYRLARVGSAAVAGTAVSVPLGAPAWHTATLRATREPLNSAGNVGDLMTSISARWYFKAGRASPTGPIGAGTLQIVPAGLDFKHLAAPGGRTKVGVQVVGMKGVRTVTVEWSTDGGKTWQTAKATGRGDAWSTRVRNPGSGAVSLRVKATARNGASVSYTVTDAYAIR